MGSYQFTGPISDTGNQSQYTTYPSPPFLGCQCAQDNVACTHPDMCSAYYSTSPMIIDFEAEMHVEDLQQAFDASWSHCYPETPGNDPSQDDNEIIYISVSTSFNLMTEPDADTTLLSSDGVLFYVRFATITKICPDILKEYTSCPKISNVTNQTHISLDSSAAELNVILHVLHGTSPGINAPDISTLVTAVDHMPKYGISPQRFIRPSSPIFELFLCLAPLYPLEVYALGAFHSITDLCVGASFHLLSFNLSTITDPMAKRMGAVYFMKLMLLHMGRSQALRNILLRAPYPHPSTKECCFEDQRRVGRAWSLVAAFLVWENPQSLTTHSMQGTLDPIVDKVDCKDCKQSLKAHIKGAVAQWALEKVSD